MKLTDFEIHENLCRFALSKCSNPTNAYERLLASIYHRVEKRISSLIPMFPTEQDPYYFLPKTISRIF